MARASVFQGLETRKVRWPFKIGDPRLEKWPISAEFRSARIGFFDEHTANGGGEKMVVALMGIFLSAIY